MAPTLAQWCQAVGCRLQPPRALASLVLDQARTEIRYNSEWSLPLGSMGMIQLAAKYTVARMMERDDFKKRYSNGQSIAIHEFLYPLLQGYDSVALKADASTGWSRSSEMARVASPPRTFSSTS